MSDCERVREDLLDFLRERQSEPERRETERHLEQCAACQKIVVRERALDRALAQRPQHALPSALRARLEARVAAATPARPARSLSRFVLVFGPLAAAALLVIAFSGRAWVSSDRRLLNEAVNDHLRVLYAAHPIEIESGGIHQVKPWFSGRLDFAPPLAFSGDEEFPLQGGAIAWFVDRKAATFVFKHKLHTITLFVFQSAGFDWPLHGNVQLGDVSGNREQLRGFNTLLWRDADLGYALVSDVNPDELVRLAHKVRAR